MKASAIILCGGKDSRFGSNKGLAVVGGRRVIDRVLDEVGPLSSQTLIVTSMEKPDIPAPSDAEILFDEYHAKGPLGGIYTGLLSSKHAEAIVVGCDMPFVNRKLLAHMLEISAGYDAVIPKLEGDMFEPLHAVYSRTCVPAMKERLEIGKLSLNKLIRDLNVRYVERDEYAPFDPRMISFFNINYPEDLERANELAREADLTSP